MLILIIIKIEKSVAYRVMFIAAEESVPNKSQSAIKIEYAFKDCTELRNYMFFVWKARPLTSDQDSFSLDNM